jgi:fermentation-respiration switch protein FrsA (DUF1100 family)
MGRWRAVALAGALGLLTGCEDGVERHFLYFPTRALSETPGTYGLPFEEVWFQTEDGVRLHGWFVPRQGARATLLWLHGNAGNIGHRAHNLRQFHDALGINVFLFDYRGYGLSDGEPSEAGLMKDAEAAWRLLGARPDVDPGGIILFGRSLGAAVAAELGVRVKPAALILESPFTTLMDMARHHYWFLPVRGLVRSRYDTLGAVRRVRAPVLVLHGDSDEIVPLDMGEQVFAAANEPKAFHRIRGASHNDTYLVGGKPYWEALRAFLATALAPGRIPG